MPILGSGSKGDRHWTVEHGGTQGLIVSSWAPHPKLGWVQTDKPEHDRRELLVRDLDDLDALIGALKLARRAIVERQGNNGG